MSGLRGIPQLPFHPQRSAGKPASASPGPPAPEPRGPELSTPSHPRGPCRGTPRTSPQGWLSPETSCKAAGSESLPQVIPPRAGGGGGGSGCDPNGPLHAPGRAAGGRGASHAGRGHWGGARSPLVPSRAARAGHPGSGRGAGGRSPGARPRGRAPPRGARGRPAPEPREEGTGGDRGGPQRPGLPGPRPAAGCARSLPDQRRAGPYHCAEGGNAPSAGACACAPPVRPLRTDTPAGVCCRSLRCC